MESNPDKNNLAESKVLILYILTKLGKPISTDGLFKIISSINGLNYFYFQEVFKDLVDTGYIRYVDDNQTIVEITSEGESAYALTKDILPGIIKLNADNVFEEEFSKVEEESSVTAEFIPIGEDNYTVKCKVIENNEVIFEVKTFAGSRDGAKKICNNWQSNAATLYPKIMNLLIED